MQFVPADADGSDGRDDDNDERDTAGDQKHVTVSIAVETVLSATITAPVCNIVNTDRLV